MEPRLKELIDKSNSIVFFGGAGVSTESGIPDFRSEEGLYKAQKNYGKSPESLLSYSFYRNNRETFFKFYKENLIHRDAKPNEAHKTLAELEKQGKLLAVVTQNIDGLHQLAGNKKVFELHGTVLENYCESCGEAYDLDYIMNEENCENGVPHCKKCGGYVKPNVVLYEEALDEGVINGAVSAISQCDLLIIGGTSLVVYPAAGLVTYFRGDNLVLINKSKTPYDRNANLAIYDSIGKVMKL